MKPWSQHLTAISISRRMNAIVFDKEASIDLQTRTIIRIDDEGVGVAADDVQGAGSLQDHVFHAAVWQQLAIALMTIVLNAVVGRAGDVVDEIGRSGPKRGAVGAAQHSLGRGEGLHGHGSLRLLQAPSGELPLGSRGRLLHKNVGVVEELHPCATHTCITAVVTTVVVVVQEHQVPHAELLRGAQAEVDGVLDVRGSGRSRLAIREEIDDRAVDGGELTTRLRAVVVMRHTIVRRDHTRAGRRECGTRSDPHIVSSWRGDVEGVHA